MLAERDRRAEGRAARVTGFGAAGRTAGVARLLVLEMILWPGLLFAAVTPLLAWEARASLPALLAVAFATLASVLIGSRQWDVMPRSVMTPAETTPKMGDASPRPTGRGSTRC